MKSSNSTLKTTAAAAADECAYVRATRARVLRQLTAPRGRARGGGFRAWRRLLAEGVEAVDHLIGFDAD